MIAWGNTTDRILFLLAKKPMTKAEICRLLDLSHDRVAGVLSRLNRATKRTSKRIYISGYTRHAINSRTYIRPIYSLGDKPNKKCDIQPFTLQERQLRSYKKLMSLRNNSIFNQSLTTRQIAKQRRRHERIGNNCMVHNVCFDNDDGSISFGQSYI